jgi:transposase
VERTFAHVCETGGARRTWLRGLEKVSKRYLIAAMSHNLGCLMRELFGMGTPRGLQAEGKALLGSSAALQLAQTAVFVVWKCFDRFHRLQTGMGRFVPRLRLAAA